MAQDNAGGSALDNVKTIADIIGTLITALAVVVGAVWAYYRFVKDRTYRPRLEVSMAGKWLSVDNERLLLARVRVKNIGASSVGLLQRGTGLRISRLNNSSSPGPLGWERGRVYSILQEHSWIEPDETVSDDVLLRLEVMEGQPVLFETRLVWEWRGGKHNIELFARQVMSADSTLDSGTGAGSGLEEKEIRNG